MDPGVLSLKNGKKRVVSEIYGNNSELWDFIRQIKGDFSHDTL
jgi:hypothetical protein